MKKILSLLTSMITISFLFIACSKSTDRILVKNDGKWDWETIQIEKINGTTVDNINDKGVITFDKSSYTLVYSTGEIEKGTWITIDDKFIMTTNGFSVSFDVIESKKKSQIFQYLYSYTEDDRNYENLITVKLTR